jgi:hypothetical protein
MTSYNEIFVFTEFKGIIPAELIPYVKQSSMPIKYNDSTMRSILENNLKVFGDVAFQSMTSTILIATQLYEPVFIMRDNITHKLSWFEDYFIEWCPGGPDRIVWKYYPPI